MWPKCPDKAPNMASLRNLFTNLHKGSLYLPTVPSRCVSEIWWFSSRGKAADTRSAPPCLHIPELGAAAAAVPAGGGAEAHLDPPACWVDHKPGPRPVSWPAPRLPESAECRRSGPGGSCRGTVVGCTHRTAASGKRRGL